MQKLSSKEARDDWGGVIDAINRGEPVTIVRYGKAVGVLVPLQAEAQGLTPLEDVQTLRGMVGPLLARGR